MKRIVLTIIAAYLLSSACIFAQNPKREFRGAWLHTVHQSQYAQMNPAQTREYLVNQLDLLYEAGVNVVMFQVRPSADAFYISTLEPWSRFLTGKAGVAPKPMWDPLQFMIDECHKRGMELHAWLNPYRVTTSKNEVLPANHIYHKHPERFVTYDGKKYFDPGLPENRQFIEDVILDIITRYDLDGIHMDDYFYPYPVAKLEFPDNASFKKYGNGMKRDDWRRKNVDLLIEEIHMLIAQHRPWIRFGVHSEFGVIKQVIPEAATLPGFKTMMHSMQMCYYGPNKVGWIICCHSFIGNWSTKKLLLLSLPNGGMKMRLADICISDKT